MKITILSGSIRPGRQSHKVAIYLKQSLEERDVEVNLIDLAETPLPIFGENIKQSTVIEEGINAISDKLREADALLFVTPEYHGSFSGVLKNALDYFWIEFQKKPIGVAAASAGRMGGINASTQLQHVILSLGAYPLPLKLLVPEVQDSFNNSVDALKDSITSSTAKFLDEFLWFAAAVSNKKKEEISI